MSISCPIEDQEIKNALWTMKPFKALGPNGLYAGFFQHFWLLVGDSVKCTVKEAFAASKVPQNLNKTLITLIPKLLGVDKLSNYRPISLCNTIYKIITKIIVMRIRPLLPRIISPMQSTFVPRRKGLDNMIITQEIIHTMSGKKGKTGFMALKIDLKKAYDRLEWSFIRDTLILFNIPKYLMDVIMSCVSSSSIAVLLNGGALEEFQPSRGTRKGDPLSPNIFIICMEVLGYMIKDKCDSNLWDPVKSSRGSLAFSHLFFIDDLVLFGKADMKNC